MENDSLELARRMAVFRHRCLEAGLAITHQRSVIYETLASSCDHLAPEAVYEQVRGKIPAISLATVYKSIRTFAEIGLLREVNRWHDTQRWDANLEPHHHLVCVRCKAVTDLPAASVAPVRLEGNVPTGFQVSGFNIEVLGLCAGCAGADIQTREDSHGNTQGQ